MIDYSKMSDFEINCEIASLMGYTAKGFIHDLRSGVWNPCNNPADAWPIIEQNKITIMFEDDQWTAFGGMSIHHSREADWDFCEYDKKPLRAAMIVFLMMQDEKDG